MAIIFRIPKLSDREVTLALCSIRDEYKKNILLKLKIHPPQKTFDITDAPLDQQNSLTYIFDLNSQIISVFQLLGQSGHEAVIVRREWDKVTDNVQIADDWINYLSQSERNEIHKTYANLVASIRQKLKVADIEAAFKGDTDTSWNRYRDAQTTVINSLQQATENLIINAAQKTAELDKARAQRFEKLEADLRVQIEKERITLQATHESKLADLAVLEKALSEKQASFNTKESHYVARQKQTEQIEKIQSWLDNWSLTKGTSKKRWPIIAAYVVALVFTGTLSAYAVWHSYELLKSVDEIVKLAWWQWVSVWAKSALPLAAFVTFTIYFIRWSGDWARQHSEEEFRNRTRLVDIGRSSWLLEAVRDAQERNKEIPGDLLKELSRNLFATSSGHEPDIHPQAMSDMLLQGLSSLRLKAPDGSEVEATRNGKKK